MQVGENKEKTNGSSLHVSTELHVVFQRGQKGVGLYIQQHRERRPFPLAQTGMWVDQDRHAGVSTPITGAAMGANPEWQTPVYCWAPQRSPVPAQPTPPLLQDVTTAFNLITLSWLKCSKKTEISVPVTTESYLDLLPSDPMWFCSKTPKSPLTNMTALCGDVPIEDWLSQSRGCFLLGC